MVDKAVGPGLQCLEFLQGLLLTEIRKEEEPDIARVSIALGLVEEALTQRDPAERQWPAALPAQVAAATEAFDAFVAEQRKKLQELSDARAKVKALADAVWGHLTGSNSKDVLHVQHVSSFTRLLVPGKQYAKRNLDCAGVTTTVYAAVHALARRHGHADLHDVRMSISEDHAFLQLDPAGGREGSVEVTADSAAKRGIQADEALWRGWLYSGGKALVCSRQQAVTAAVTSINPLIVAGKKPANSEPLRALQLELLSLICREVPAAMYPAAIAALAELKEEVEMNAIEAATAACDWDKVEAALARRPGDAHALYQEAIDAAVAMTADGCSSGGPGVEGAMLPFAFGLQWYPYSYMSGFLCRRADALEECALAFPERAAALRQQTMDVFREALACAAVGAGVLASFKFSSEGMGAYKLIGIWKYARMTCCSALHVVFVVADEELYKDIGEIIDFCVDGLVIYSKEYCSGRPLEDSTLLTPLFTLWDGVCLLFSHKSKPNAWTKSIMKAAKLFTPEARVAAAEGAGARSSAMQAARPMWRDMKPGPLAAVFEAADVGNGEERASKRGRRE